MSPNMKRLLIGFFVFLFVTTGCSSTAQKLSNAATESTKSAPSTTVPVTPTGVVTKAPEPTSAPTSTPAPTEKPKPSAKDLILGDTTSFVQETDSIEVLPVFTVENPNENYAIEQATYQIAIFDAAGTVLKSDTGSINILMPGEKTAIVGDMFVDKGQTVAKVQVQIGQGSASWIDKPVKVFTVDQAVFYPDKNFPRATGIIKNGLNHDLTQVRLSAVGYDADGKVVGAGYTYVSFVPAGGQTGVSLSFKTNAATMAKVELYPALSNLSSIDEPGQSASTVKLADSGFGQADTHIGMGYILENTDTKNAIEGTQVRLIAYDDKGNVLGAEEASIEIILPGEKLGSYAETFVPEGGKVAKMEVQVKGGTSTAININGPIFTTDKVTFLADKYFPKASGVIVNGLNKNIEKMRVSALAYSAEGKIIGGGYTFLDFLPPSGQSPIDMSLVLGGTVEKVDIYPTLSSLSVLESADQAASPVQLVAYGFSERNSMVGVGFTVKNTDASTVFGGAQYQVAAYDESGKVLGTSNGYLDDLYPNAQVGVYAEMVVPDNAQVKKVDIQINPGSAVMPLIAKNPFTFENINFTPDQYFPKVTGIIKNAFEKQVTHVRVVSLTYDDKGAIIGGGYTYVDFVPGSGQAAVDMSVNVTGKPAKWEFFGAATSLSELK